MIVKLGEMIKVFGTGFEICAPGEYLDGFIMWLRADAGVTTATEGANVTAWLDQTPSSGNDGSNLTAPIYRATTELTNFNPTVDFSTGSTGITVADAAGINLNSAISKKFSVFFRTDDDITTKQVIWEQGGATRGMNLYIRANTLHMTAWNIASDGAGAPWNTGTVTTVNTTISTDTEYLVTVNLDGNDLITGTLEGFVNGQTIGTLPNVGRLYQATDDIGLGDEAGGSSYDDGTTSGAASFDGQISEISYYGDPVAYTQADRKRIESYFAVKYGITLHPTQGNRTRSGRWMSLLKS